MQCEAFCNAASMCRAYETTVDTHAHIDADNGVEHVAGECITYMEVNNYEEETTVAGNRQCYAKIDAASVGIGSYERSQANDWRFVDGANTFFMYKDTSIGGRWKVTAARSARADQVYYWGPDATSAEAVDGPPPAARWTAGEAAAGAVPPSLITCGAGVKSCSGGTYRFMAKAFQLGSTYEVPAAYALQQFTIPGSTIADGACATVVNSAGGNDQRLTENGGILNQVSRCAGQGSVAWVSARWAPCASSRTRGSQRRVRCMGQCVLGAVRVVAHQRVAANQPSPHPSPPPPPTNPHLTSAGAVQVLQWADFRPDLHRRGRRHRHRPLRRRGHAVQCVRRQHVQHRDVRPEHRVRRQHTLQRAHQRLCPERVPL
jgi:hypothetical protein